MLPDGLFGGGENMNIQTHQRIDTTLCGKPIALGDGSSRIELMTDTTMQVDHMGLVHGGFIFGLADHAAMIAVNDPNVVLGSAESKFIKPVKAGETVVAEASTESTAGKKQIVNVTVKREDQVVFEGRFTCFILDKHVLG